MRHGIGGRHIETMRNISVIGSNQTKVGRIGGNINRVRSRRRGGGLKSQADNGEIGQ